MHRFALRAGKHSFALAPGVYRIGRDLGSDIRLDDASVSRSHATLRVDEDQVIIEERGSRNGIRVNGVIRRGAVPLQEGDRLQLGMVELLLETQRDAAPSLDATRPLPRMPRVSEPPARSALSARELEVLKKIATGMTQREIAEQLGVSVKTVETYRARIAEKLGLTTRAELVSYAVRSGAVSLRRSSPPQPPRRD